MGIAPSRAGVSEITTRQMVEYLGRPDTTIIDTRDSNAYNGWPALHQVRGGHIPNARNLPAAWTHFLDWPDIVRAKEISTNDTIIVYGDTREETQTTADKLTRLGYEKCRVYHRFLSELCPDAKVPLTGLQRYRYLVSPIWLASILKNDTVPHYSSQRYALVHAHYQNRRAYEKGHIPGAVALDTNLLESPLTWNRRSSDELTTALTRHGISCDTTVILYGTDLPLSPEDPFPGSSVGQLAAMRSAFIMLYAGVKDIRILNGGLHAWTAAGFPTTTDESTADPVADFGADIPVRPKFAVDLDEAKTILASPDKNLVCVRSRQEFLGETSGYNYIRKKGRIPGAVFADCGSDAYHMENYRNPDYTVRESQEVEKAWARSGITPDKHNAFYCGTGWRASEAFFNAWLMGWPRISVYDGGWFEWSNSDDNPCETGDPDKT